MPVAWQGMSSLLIPNNVILNLHSKMSINMYIVDVIKKKPQPLSAFTAWQLSPVQPLAGLFYVHESRESLTVSAGL